MGYLPISILLPSNPLLLNNSWVKTSFINLVQPSVMIKKPVRVWDFKICMGNHAYLTLDMRQCNNEGIILYLDC